MLKYSTNLLTLIIIFFCPNEKCDFHMRDVREPEPSLSFSLFLSLFPIAVCRALQVRGGMDLT